jgi:hypothetical protein
VMTAVEQVPVVNGFSVLLTVTCGILHILDTVENRSYLVKI